MKYACVALAGAMLAVASCGRVSDLKPAAGKALPAKPLMARTTPTANELLTTRPMRGPTGSTSWSRSRSRAPPTRSICRRRRAARRPLRRPEPIPSRSPMKPARPPRRMNGPSRPQGGVSRRRPRHPPASGHQDHPQGDGHDRRPAAHSICGRRSARSGDREADLRHRARQIGARRLFRPCVRARSDDARARQEPRHPRPVKCEVWRGHHRSSAEAAGAWSCRVVRAGYHRR